MKFLTIGSVLALSGLAAAGHLHHHGAVNSYSVETKHEPAQLHHQHHGWSHGHGGDSHGLVDGHHGWEGHHESHSISHNTGHGLSAGHDSHHGWEGHHEGDSASHDAGHDHEWKHDEHHDEYVHPKYEFKYGVKDPKTGDVKEQWEERDGDKVKGGYTMKEADGTTRIVEYHADKHSGFNAVVKNIGHAHHPEVEHHYHDGGHTEYDHGHGW
ncbi:uncharacterized protein [Musca autumnalis]|uniref:uncharacterized protein n=1 Tax=Musca autumnalis TaxID=221902 RepID=UPI003CE67D0B